MTTSSHKISVNSGTTPELQTPDYLQATRPSTSISPQSHLPSKCTIDPKMSSNNRSSSSYSYSYSSTSYSSSSASSTDRSGNSYSQRYTQSSTTNPRTGTTIHRTAEETGKPPISETTRIPAGAQIAGSGAGGLLSGRGLPDDGARRIEDVTQSERDAEYDERIEDEYAKREGGA